MVALLVWVLLAACADCRLARAWTGTTASADRVTDRKTDRAPSLRTSAPPALASHQLTPRSGALAATATSPADVTSTRPPAFTFWTTFSTCGKGYVSLDGNRCIRDCALDTTVAHAANQTAVVDAAGLRCVLTSVTPSATTAAAPRTLSTATTVRATATVSAPTAAIATTSGVDAPTAATTSGVDRATVSAPTAATTSGVDRGRSPTCTNDRDAGLNVQCYLKGEICVCILVPTRTTTTTTQPPTIITTTTTTTTIGGGLGGGTTTTATGTKDKNAEQSPHLHREPADHQHASMTSSTTVVTAVTVTATAASTLPATPEAHNASMMINAGLLPTRTATASTELATPATGISVTSTPVANAERPQTNTRGPHVAVIAVVAGIVVCVGAVVGTHVYAKTKQRGATGAANSAVMKTEMTTRRHFSGASFKRRDSRFTAVQGGNGVSSHMDAGGAGELLELGNIGDLLGLLEDDSNTNTNTNTNTKVQQPSAMLFNASKQLQHDGVQLEPGAAKFNPSRSHPISWVAQRTTPPLTTTHFGVVEVVPNTAMPMPNTAMPMPMLDFGQQHAHDSSPPHTPAFVQFVDLNDILNTASGDEADSDDSEMSDQDGSTEKDSCASHAVDAHYGRECRPGLPHVNPAHGDLQGQWLPEDARSHTRAPLPPMQHAVHQTQQGLHPPYTHAHTRAHPMYLNTQTVRQTASPGRPRPAAIVDGVTPDLLQKKRRTIFEPAGGFS